MTVTAIDEKNVAKKAKPVPKGRVEFQAPEDFISRLERVAEKLGISVSAYIRLAMTEDMDRKEDRWKERGESGD